MNTETERQTDNREFDSSDESRQASSTGGDKEHQMNSQTFSGEDQVELKYRSPKNVGAAKFAKSLGIFSIALGLAEVLAPAQVGELIGVSHRYRRLIPALGAREIAHGLGILYQAKPTAAVWSRVGGDAIDLAFLGAAFMGEENNKNRLVGATAAVVGVMALDIMCARMLTSDEWSDADGNMMAPTTVGQSSGRRAFSA